MLIGRSRVFVFSIAAAILCSGMASGQDYPIKPIRIITGSVGGGNDFTSRQIAQGISGALGQQVIVENRSSALVAETVARAPADGYTLMVQGGTVWLTPLLQKVNYEMSQFAPLSLISRDIFILAAHPSVPAKSVRELIDLAKAQPGVLNYSTGTPGGSATLAGALLRSMAGINVVAIPYAGNGPILTAVMSGEVHYTFLDPGMVLPHVKSGRLRALAVTSATRSALAPDLPPVAAALPGYEAVGMTVMFVPAKTPAALIERLNQEIVRFLSGPQVRERFLKAGLEVVASSADELAATLRADTAKWARVIKDAGIKVN